MRNLNDFEPVDNYEEETHEAAGKEAGKEGRSGDVNTHTHTHTGFFGYFAIQ